MHYLFFFFIIICLNWKIKLKISFHAYMLTCMHQLTRAWLWDRMPKCFNVKVLNRTKKSRAISTWIWNNLDNSVAKMCFRNYRTFTPPCLRTGRYNVRKGQNEFYTIPLRYGNVNFVHLATPQVFFALLLILKLPSPRF